MPSSARAGSSAARTLVQWSGRRETRCHPPSPGPRPSDASVDHGPRSAGSRCTSSARRRNGAAPRKDWRLFDPSGHRHLITFTSPPTREDEWWNPCRVRSNRRKINFESFRGPQPTPLTSRPPWTTLRRAGRGVPTRYEVARALAHRSTEQHTPRTPLL